MCFNQTTEFCVTSFNLISNASKYSDAGKKIYIKCSWQENEIIFQLREEGIGIPEENF